MLESLNIVGSIAQPFGLCQKLENTPLEVTSTPVARNVVMTSQRHYNVNDVVTTSSQLFVLLGYTLLVLNIY